MSETIILNKESNTAIITINRPEALNALNGQVLDEFDRALTQMIREEKRWILI